MSGQLSLDAELPTPPNPNAHLFDEHGRPRRLMWCSDSARLGGECPHGGTYRDGGPCCKDFPGALEHQAAVAARVAANRRSLGA